MSGFGFGGFDQPKSRAMFKKCKFLPKVPLEDLKSLSGMLVKAMEIRERYMRFSHQKFPGFVKR